MANYEHITVDTSFACYFTDYMLAILLLYLYLKISNLDKNHTLEMLKLSRFRAEIPLKIFHQKSNFILKLLKFSIVFELITCLLGGLFHQFFPTYQKIFDYAGNFNLLASFYLFLAILLLMTEENVKIFNFVEDHLGKMVALLILEENIFHFIGFKKLKFLNYLVTLLMVTVLKLPTIQDAEIKILNFYKFSYQLAMILACLTAGLYLKIEAGCRVPRAFEQGSCPLPDYFNHNAVMHLMLGYVYYLCFSSFYLAIKYDKTEHKKDS